MAHISITNLSNRTDEMTEQLKTPMTQMRMEKKSTTKSLTEINKTMVNILSKKYGLKEDPEFITPLKPTKDKVRMSF